MKKGLVSVLLAVSMMLTLAGCGGQAAPAAPPQETAAESGTASGAGESEVKDEETPEAAADAKLEDSLVIYTTHPEDLVEAISDKFTEKTGVEVEFINLKGELADRIRSEKENPQADIMFGGDTATYMLLQSEGCYAPTTPSWADAIDDNYKEAEGYWYGTYRTPMVLFYNSETMAKEAAPTDWADLTKPEYAEQIVTRDSLSSSMRSTIVSLIQNIKANDSEEAAWNYIEALGKNTKNYYNSGSMMFQAVGKGEASISMAVINDVLKNRDSNEMPLEMVIPTSGAVVITDCIAATNNAPHPNAAAAFIDFVGSEECQVMAANDFNRMPVSDDILSQCPEWMQTEFSVLPVDWNEVSANQSAWLEKWETDYLDTAKAVASN